jgi:hypothetical protein
MNRRVPAGLVRITTSSFVAAISAESRTTRFFTEPVIGSTAITLCDSARPT